MKWLLDTNVVSEGIRNRPDRKVMAWVSSQPSEDTAISAMTLAELRDGAATTSNEARRAAFTRWIETDVLKAFEEQILPVTVDVLIDWIQLAQKLRKRGTPREAADMLIASTARVHNLTLVTRNVRDFADTGVVVYDPWHDKTHRMDAP